MRTDDGLVKKLKLPRTGTAYELVSAASLRKGDIFLAETDDVIPFDGEVTEGAALVNEGSATGVSDPVLHDSDEPRNAVLRGSKVISGSLVIKVTGLHSS